MEFLNEELIYISAGEGPEKLESCVVGGGRGGGPGVGSAAPPGAPPPPPQ